MKYSIGDFVRDEDGNTGIVVIRWNDGDICEYENDAAHPNPVIIEKDNAGGDQSIGSMQIELLLHGEEKEKSNKGIPIRDGDGNLCFPEKEKPWPDPADIIQMRGKEQKQGLPFCDACGSFHPQGAGCAPRKQTISEVDPDEGRNPIPSSPAQKETRTQWANRKPNFWTNHDLPEWVEATKQWLREEPEKCETCAYRTAAPHDGLWCYMFEKKMDGCRRYLKDKIDRPTKPTEDEWEKWIDELPNQMEYKTWYEFADALLKALRTIPRGKCG